MNNAIVIDNEKKTYKRLFFRFDNNKLSVLGYKFIDNKLCGISYSDLLDFKELLFPDKSRYIMDKDDYSIFIDKYNHKHYLKDGTEDYIKFFQKNDLGAYEFSKKDVNSFAPTQSYKIKKGRKTFLIKVVSATALVSMLSFVGANLYKQSNEIFDNPPSNENIEIISYTDKSEENDNDLLNSFYFEDTSLNANDLIDLINNSSLDDEMKSYIINENLMQDVIEYYKNTSMEYLIKERLTNIEVKYFTEEPIDDNILLGYYDILENNVIHLNTEYSYEFCFGHEFIHMLQSPFCDKVFFKETMADIVASEYLNETYDCYTNQDYLMKVLLNTIGPEPVWEYCFGGDYSKIDNILTTYLDFDDYDRINKLFEEDFTEDNSELESLLFKLYYQMYGMDIKNNRNIFDPDGDLIDKTYFNEDIMPSREYSNYYGTYTDNIRTMFPDQKIRKSTNLSRLN